MDMIPDFQTAMLPLLQSIKDGKVYNSWEIRQKMISFFSISDVEQKEKTPNGKQLLYYNRIAWSISYLRTANLLFSPERGKYQITESGIRVLKNPPDKITIKFLRGFSNYTLEKTTSGQIEEFSNTSQSIKTPDEMIEEGFEQINSELSKLLLSQLESVTPYRFEEIVLELLLKMGYGGFDLSNGKVTKASGDEGIDGIIKEDKLGLDKIYIQAKKWKHGSNKVGRPEIQKFVGALDGQRAKKGIFITTSNFSKEAIDYAAKTNNVSIVLIDGTDLAKLMIDYEIGITIKDVYKIGKIDTDYFVEE